MCLACKGKRGISENYKHGCRTLALGHTSRSVTRCDLEEQHVVNDTTHQATYRHLQIIIIADHTAALKPCLTMVKYSPVLAPVLHPQFSHSNMPPATIERRKEGE